jgi:hypothetical protein
MKFIQSPLGWMQWPLNPPSTSLVMITFPTLNLMFLQGKVLFHFEEVFNTVFLENENVCICVGNSDSLLIIKFTAVCFKLLGYELPEGVDQPEHVETR